MKLEGKTALVPKVDEASHTMIAVAIDSLEAGLERSRYGILEPTASEARPPGEIDLVIAPGLAFDRAGNRLGRGGGYYDRFLAQDELRAVVCGVAFNEQVISDLPTDERDRRVGMLVTDREVFRFNESEGAASSGGGAASLL